MDYLSIKKAIPKNWKSRKKKNILTEEIVLKNNIIYNMETVTTKQIYQILIENKNITPSCINKWENEIPNLKKLDNNGWQQIFLRTFIISGDSKKQIIQYKLIHRITTCNKKLFEYKITSNPLCSFCQEIDTLQHFFITCKDTLQLWKNILNWWNKANMIL